MLGLWLAAAPGAAAQNTPTYPDAVVLVSGYNSSTAFTSPDAACEGQEGDTWNVANGPAAALRAAGFNVFTAPVQHGTDQILPPCTTSGAPVPPAGTYINSFGDLDANGAALAGFLAFLRDSYGVQRIHLVAHSNGGNWSRAAFTQNAAYAGLQARSLTTLGTPYTGSFLADLAVELNNGQCDFSSKVEQALCNAVLSLVQTVFANMGPTTIRELTHGYMETWNPQQQIGSCPVTTIAGTYLNLVVPLTYYNPSDGLVGEASAQAHSAYDISFDLIPAPDIPGLSSAGTFPVVHSPALSILSNDNLLNQQAISSDVVEIVNGIPANGPLCTPASGAGGEDSNQARLRLPLRVFDAPSRSGKLVDPGVEDVVVATGDTRVRCGLATVPLIPLPATRRVQVGFPAECERTLRVIDPDGERRARRGFRDPGSRPRALLLRSKPASDVVVRSDGDRVDVNVRGRSVEAVKVQITADGETDGLDLGPNGGAPLPEGEGRVTLEVRTKHSGGGRGTATAVLER